MSSLIKQLQKSAIDKNVKCSELLTMAYYTAIKINDTELANYCKNEIEGYKDARSLTI